MAIHVNTGIKEVDSLLSRGGMASMLKTLWIIIGAVTFGTLLEEFKLLAKLINPILERAKTTGGLIAAVVGTALGLNIIAADQYIALVLPVRLYRTEFEKRGLKPQNLSRACCGCRNGDIAPCAVELVRRIHGRRARRNHHGVFAVCHLQHHRPAHVAIVGIHWIQDRAHPARRSAGRDRTDSLAKIVAPVQPCQYCSTIEAPVRFPDGCYDLHDRRNRV